MKRVTVLALVALAVSLSMHTRAQARELGRRVHLKDGKNVVAGTGETLDFRLDAERGGDGTVQVSIVIPRDSPLQKASHLRLQVRDEKRIVLWLPLETRKRDDGSTTAAFHIHDTLAKGADIGIAFDGGPNSRGMYAYLIPLSEYIRDRK